LQITLSKLSKLLSNMNQLIYKYNNFLLCLYIMSLATFKRKTKQLRNVKIGYKQRLAKSDCCVNPGNSVESPNRSYNNIYRNRRVFNFKNKNGGCCSEIVKPVRDGTAQHRLERLTTHHLKEENVAKMTFAHKEILEGCRDHHLNIIEDESGKTKSAEHVMNKKKACLMNHITQDLQN